MDLVALKNNKNTKHTIHQFKKMSDIQREELKGLICCPICDADAYYRGESSDGKRACFCAKHLNDCDNGASNKSNNEDGDEETNRIELDTSIFNIRWNYNSLKSKASAKFEDSKDQGMGKNIRKYSQNPSIVKQATLSLSQILTYAEEEVIENQDIIIKLDQKEYDLSEVVFKMSDINDNHINQKGFYWGEMRYLNKNFINMRNCEDVSILIDNSILDKFNTYHKDKFFKVVASNSVIVFGNVILTSNNKFLIVLDDINKIYFRRK